MRGMEYGGRKMKKLCLILPVAGLLTGCETIQLQTAATRARTAEDQRIAMEHQQRMAGRLETIEMEMARISRDLDTLRVQLGSRCAAIEQKSEQDKREMVARVSGELDKLAKQAAAAPAPAGAYGIEHTVRPGETLSTIATAYGVQVKKLIEVNNIQNPNVLSVGQKLFIPQ